MQRFAVLVPILATVVACGDVPVDPGTDAATDPKPDGHDVDPDAAPPARCDLAKPFGAPTLVAGVNGASDDRFARLSADELTIYFASTRPGGPGGLDLYQATRDTRDGSFGTPSLMPISTAADDWGATATADGLGLYFSRRNAAGTGDILLATRGNLQTEFGGEAVLAQVNTTAEDNEPYLTADDRVLYFTSSRDAGYHLYRAERTGAGGFGNVQRLAEVDSPSSDAWAVPSADDLHLIWGSDRADGGNAGRADIWEASRSPGETRFGNIARNAELSSAGTDEPDWLSADGCVIYFASDRAGTTGGLDIWKAQRGR